MHGERSRDSPRISSASCTRKGPRNMAESRAADSITVHAISSNGWSFCVGMMGSMAVL
jgi:hypothetical protein